MTSATLPAANVAKAAAKSLERFYGDSKDYHPSEQEIATDERLQNLEALAAAATLAMQPEPGFVDVSTEDFSLIRDFYEADP